MNHDILDNSENCTNEALQTNGSSGHDPLCPVAYTGAEIYWRAKCPYCVKIAKVRENEREYVLATLLRMPVGAVMEIACPACGWDYGHESDLLDLFGAYNEHDCQASQEKS